MWDDSTSFYYDRFKDGSLSHVKSIAAYWALLAQVVEVKNADRFINHLSDTGEFSRLWKYSTGPEHFLRIMPLIKSRAIIKRILLGGPDWLRLQC